MDMIFQIIKKYEDIVLYGFFGVCTTIINLISYFFFYNILKFSNVASTCIAWTIAVAFAYITNKIFVFKSKSFNFDILVKEILSFFGCGFLTGILDVKRDIEEYMTRFNFSDINDIIGTVTLN